MLVAVLMQENHLVLPAVKFGIIKLARCGAE